MPKSDTSTLRSRSPKDLFVAPWDALLGEIEEILDKLRGMVRAGPVSSLPWRSA